jgi:hypothetical protein
MGDFIPSAWTGGVIFGSMSSGATSWLVGVNPSTLSVSRLSPDASNVGIVGTI